MCVQALAPIFAGLGGSAAGATAAGATAAAATTGLTLQGVGTALMMGGQLYQGIQASRTAKANAALVAQQRETEQAQFAQRDLRARREFTRQMRKQVAELAARGVSIDSPTAVLLGQEAASELSFQSQSIRSTGQARDTELSAQERSFRARATQDLLSGGLGAAGTFLAQAPKLWPSLGD